MKFIIYSISLIIGFIFVIGNLVFLSNKILSLRYNKRQLLFISALTTFNLYIINISGLSIIKTLLILSIYLIFIMFVYYGSLIKKMLIFSFFCLFTFISELLTANIVNLIFGMNNKTSQGSLEFLVAVLLSNIFLYILCHFFIYLYNFLNIKELPKSTWIILILPITTILLIFNIQEYFYLFRNNKIFIIIFIGLIVSNFITTYFFYKAISSIYIKNELNILKINEEYLENKYKLLQVHYSHNFKFTHDILKKSISIRKIFDEKNYEMLDKELDILVNDSFKQFNTIYSNYIIVNTLLNENIDILNKNNIIFSTTIEFNNFTFLSNLDEYQLFDKLIKLSITSAIYNSAMDQKNIILKTKQLHQQVIVEIIYPSCNLSIVYDFYEDIEVLIGKYNGAISKEISSFNQYCSLIILFRI